MLSREEVIDDLETLVRARYPLIYIVSWEEQRVIEALAEIARKRRKKLYSWSISQGMTESDHAPIKANLYDARTALDYIAASRDPAVFVLKDFHQCINDANIIRRLRDLTGLLKTSYKTIFIISPILKLPPELEKDITVVDFPLPDLDDIEVMLEGIIKSVDDNPQIDVNISAEEKEQIIKAAQGLTLNEAENVFAKSLVEKYRLDIDVILSEKEQIIRKSGMLEYYRATEAFTDVGGMRLLKDWLTSRTMAFSKKARDFGLPQPKGIMLLGVQGCGKSLCCKAVASLWKLPLLRLDVGKIFSGIIGSSEENVRRAINVAESVAPAVLWIDELDKGFAGTQSSPFSDSGTTSRVFGTFVTWLQEKTAPVFVVATANDISNLPPELLRKGRFDEIFFVDLPSKEERKDIFNIHLRKRKRDPSNFDIDVLVDKTEGFNGAEIEQLVIDALYSAFGADRDVTTEDLIRCAEMTVPLSMTVKEQIDKLRSWAADRCRPANDRALFDKAGA